VRWFPFINPPPVAWLVAPLTALPAPVAYVPWVLLVSASLIGAALLLAPRDRLSRALFAALALGFLPTFVAVAFGQLAPIVGLGLAAAWVLLGQGRQVAAGLALSVIALKPQLAVLVPLALLAAGYRRAFLTAAAAGLLLAGISLASLGGHGLYAYRELATPLFGDLYFQRWSLTPLTGSGPLWFLAVLLAAAATAAVAWRNRGDPGLAIAAGVAGSLLVNHYLTVSDFVILLVPLWLVLREPRPAWLLALCGLTWLAGWFSLAFGPPVIVAEVALLLALAVSRRPGTQAPSLSGHAQGPP
jgi:hypothetical protein